jgi:medium-chain acyl-[acyl-carrier-protein] hydrolase
LRPRWSHLSNEEFIEKIRPYGGLNDQVLSQADLMEIFLPTLRADREVFESYSYTREGPLECPIVTLSGMDDRQVRREDLLAWKDETSGPFLHRDFPGGHFFLNEMRSEVIRAIETVLMEHAPARGSDA